MGSFDRRIPEEFFPPTTFDLASEFARTEAGIAIHAVTNTTRQLGSVVLGKLRSLCSPNSQRETSPTFDVEDVFDWSDVQAVSHHLSIIAVNRQGRTVDAGAGWKPMRFPIFEVTEDPDAIGFRTGTANEDYIL